ncbi:MAG: hypothetical protein VXZ18_07360 [Pseudomonadota bacterium]|uniref:HdeA/HdeB family protein n=1 Tax=Thalassococcus halodurans TaxID=373675 RepID=A0A1H5SQM3_9RHOB|nr:MULTISPECIES: hypothetical protein [Thalassococcus]MBO6868636.1 hypothetical protein [Thalassococcus sp.]MEC8580551.1 hypothetical protein [Pseudomonadota bacterium]SEF52067.1 hypothetical protein SAMN04488045_0308 [Thalassococcus halodurans]
MHKTAAITAFFALTATSAFALDKDAECGIQADVVMSVVEARTGGQDADASVTAVAEGLDDQAQKYVSVVPAIVEWVYSLPEDQLGAEVGESWATACKAQ